MAKDIPEIMKKAAGRDGLTPPPEGYFDDFARHMAEALPHQAWEDEATPGPIVQLPKPMTRWQRVRPYVYMAAMFAGIWCMFKMFSLMSGTNDNSAIDNNPVLAAAVADEDFVNDYFVSDLNQYDIYDEMIDDSIPPEDIQADDLMQADQEYILPTGAQADDAADIDSQKS